jgi:hypothetical protein
MMDNKVFNVNGDTKERLLKALELVMGTTTVAGWRVEKTKGLILLWHVDKDKGTALPTPLDFNATTDIAWAWLNSKEGQEFKPIDEWDTDTDHDGSNERGWRVYVESWGHIRDGKNSIDHYSICAIVPAYCWYGK